MRNFKLTRFFSFMLCLLMLVSALPVDQVAAASKNDKVATEVRRIVSLMPSSADSDAEKALWLHDYVVEHVDYVFGANDQTAYGALIEGKAVCAGYADAYKELLTAVGIQCETITGYADNGSGSREAHAWSMVWIGQKCYFTDVTWDDPFVNGVQELRHTYFNLSLEQMNKDHYPDDASKALLPESCNHTDLDYYSLCSGKGNGVGVFNDKTSAETAAKSFAKTSKDGETCTFSCDFRFDGKDLSGWINKNWAAIAEELGFYCSYGCQMSFSGSTCLLEIYGTWKGSDDKDDDDKREEMKITSQPKTQKVKADATAKFKVTATGENLTYQWQYRTSKNGTWKPCTVSSGKTATLKVSATTGKSGYYYRCKITDDDGNVVYTNSVRLYVLGVKTQSKTQKVEAGETAKFTVSATGSNKTYQWQYRTSKNGEWKTCTATGNKTATLKVSATTGKSGYYYRCKITDDAGNVVYTDSVRLYVLGVKTQPGNKTVKEGKTAKFTVSATGSGVTYQWQYKNSAGKWVNTTLTGAKTATLSVKATDSRNGVRYRCKITDSAGNVVYSNVVKLTVK